MKGEWRRTAKVKTQLTKALAEQDGEVFFDTAITWAEDECMNMAKASPLVRFWGDLAVCVSVAPAPLNRDIHQEFQV